MQRQTKDRLIERVAGDLKGVLTDQGVRDLRQTGLTEIEDEAAELVDALVVNLLPRLFQAQAEQKRSWWREQQTRCFPAPQREIIAVLPRGPLEHVGPDGRADHSCSW